MLKAIDPRIFFNTWRVPEIRGKEVIAIVIDPPAEYQEYAKINFITLDQNFILEISAEQLQKLAEAI